MATRASSCTCPEIQTGTHPPCRTKRCIRLALSLLSMEQMQCSGQLRPSLRGLHFHVAVLLSGNPVFHLAPAHPVVHHTAIQSRLSIHRLTSESGLLPAYNTAWISFDRIRSFQHTLFLSTHYPQDSYDQIAIQAALNSIFS